MEVRKIQKRQRVNTEFSNSTLPCYHAFSFALAPPKGNTHSAKLPLALEQYLNDHPEIERITLCLDNDKTGIGTAFHYAKKLMNKYNINIELPRGGKDFNEVLNR